MTPKIRTLHSDHAHYGWDRGIAPVLTVAPGETVTIACRDAGDGRWTATRPMRPWPRATRAAPIL